MAKPVGPAMPRVGSGSVDAGRGLFITLEGGEGAGKTTQLRLLEDRLLAAGRDVLTTREPGGSPRAEAIRALLLGGAVRREGAAAETLMFAAARADHLRRTIRPALERGVIVLCDRFVDSTRVYQGAVAGVSRRLIATLERVVLDGVQPDLTVLLDVPAKLGLARADQRRAVRGEVADRFEGEGLDFHDRVRQAFLGIAAAEPRRFEIVDASRDPTRVGEDVWAAVARLTEPSHASRAA